MSFPLRSPARRPGALERVSIRALDIGCSVAVLTASAPLLLLLALRSKSLGKVRFQGGWVYAVGEGSALRPFRGLPLWWSVLNGRWGVVGAGAWREQQPLTPLLKPGLVSLAEIRGVNGLARRSRAELDRELAARWGLRTYLGLLARALPALALRRGSDRVRGQVDVAGIPLQNASMRALIKTIEGCARAGLRWWGCFVNADCVNQARANPDYRACLRRCDVVLPDGIGVRLAARLSGQAMGENLVGTDLLPELCRLSSRTGLRVFLLGGAPGVAREAARKLEQRFPGVRIVGAAHGYFRRDHEEERELLRGIELARPHILLVGFGAPLQELWIDRHRADLTVPVLLGVGGLFDYYSGRVPRAPIWLRESGLEWAYRLWQEPARLWKRYVLGNPRFLLATARDLLSNSWRLA